MEKFSKKTLPKPACSAGRSLFYKERDFEINLYLTPSLATSGRQVYEKVWTELLIFIVALFELSLNPSLKKRGTLLSK